MKKYVYSFMFHIAALLMLLLFVRWTPDVSSPIPVENVIVVDFTDRTTISKARTKPLPEKTQPKPVEEKTAPQPIKTEIPKAAPEQSQKQQEQAKPSEAAPKADVKSTALVDQEKIRAAEQLAKERQQEALAKAKEEAEKEAARAKAEAEKAKKEAEKAEKKSFFDNLIKDSKKKADAAAEAANSKSQSQASVEAASDHSDLSNDISSRQVLKKPNIVDNSQKEGRVVVKICVDGTGKVISANYTQVGSTTTDAHLIDLAEKGVMEYIFSESPAERQCGRVFIDFRLRA